MFLIERAELVSFSSMSYTATVRLAGSLASVTADVPVSRAIDAGELTPGRTLAVAVFDDGTPHDAMVVGVH